MASVLYAGWNGGYVGRAIGDGLVALVGGTAYALPVGCLAVGLLMVARSDLPRFGPFRTGLVVTTLALGLVLGRPHGGYLGRGLEAVFGSLVGSTGTRLLGVFLLLAGGLLVSGASVGAFLRRSGRAVRRAAKARPARRAAPVHPAPHPVGPPLTDLLAHGDTPVNVVEDFPDVVAPSPLLVTEEDEADEERPSLFDVTEERGTSVYTASRPGHAATLEGSAARSQCGQRPHGRGPRPGARQLRGRRARGRRDFRAAGHPVRASARSRDEGGEGRRPQGRPLVRACDDGDSDPGADPRQAGRRGRGAEPRAEPRHPRRRLRRPAGDGEPALRLARQGHLRQRGVDRPGADAAPADRGDDRLGQVRLHQHDPHVDPPACDPRRRPDDPDRPEADRARLLRVDPASADLGRVEPEDRRRRAGERRRRDGAPLRADEHRASAQPAGDEPGAAGPGREAAPVPPRRHRRAGRPDDDLAASRRGRDHPARPEVARRGHPPGAGDAAAIG